MRLRHICLIAVSLGLGAAACGGSSDDGVSTGKNVPIEDVPKLYAGAACNAYESCVSPALLKVYLNGESCDTNVETTIADELPRIKQGIADGKIVYDGTKVEACMAALEALGCSLDEEPAECVAAINGTVAVGGDCEMDAECLGPGTYCKVDASCPGKCANKELAGATCDRNDNCAAGLQCSEDTQKCFVPAKKGEACGGGGTAPDCGPGTFCIGSDDDGKKPGTCMDSAEAFSGKQGDACFFGGKPACSADLFCVVSGIDTTTGTLQTKCDVAFGAGAACKPAIPDACPADQYCKITTPPFDGTCTPKPAAGEPCGKGLGDDPPNICAPNTRCDGGTCRPRQHLGGQCQEDAVCFSENCVSGGCAPAGGCS